MHPGKLKKTIISALFSLGVVNSTCALAADYNYAEALQKGIFFYDIQRVGKLTEQTGNLANRVYWRGNAFLQDYALPNSEGSLDLGGGFADAGDNPKFNFPMASAMTVLAWSLLEFSDGYEKSSQSAAMRANLRWGMDYLLKCWDAKHGRLYGQVSPDSVSKAHAVLWMPHEVGDQAAIDRDLPRYGFYVDAKHPGTDLAGETVAAMTAASLVFQNIDVDYAKKLLMSAKEIYSTLVDVENKGKYSENMGRMVSGSWKKADISSFYNSWSGYKDEIAWSSMWLYRATGDASYLPMAEANIMYGNTVATLSWDDKSYGTYLLMAKFLPDSDKNKAQALESAKGWLNAWSIGDGNHEYSKDGLMIASVLTPWGNARYAATTAFGAEIYDKYFATTVYANFAKSQVDYLLGDNSKQFSFICGFGDSYPKQPHHATGQGMWSGINDLNLKSDNRHILYGALVGGPKDTDDTYTDYRGDYIGNEVALDYNAGFVGALAALVEEHGGTPLPKDKFPPTAISENAPLDEIFVNGKIQSAQKNSNNSVIQVSLLATNHSAWPARVTHNLKVRYFISVADKPTNASFPSVKTFATDSRAVVSGPTVYDISKGIYYIDVWFKDIPIYPGGDERQISSKETQLQITYPWAHDFTKDWSYEGLTSSGMNQAKHVPIYTVNPDGSDTKLYGEEPEQIPQAVLKLNFATNLPKECMGIKDSLLLANKKANFTVDQIPFIYVTAIGGPFSVSLASSSSPIDVTGGVCIGKLNQSSVNVPGNLYASYTFEKSAPKITGTLALSVASGSDVRCDSAMDTLYIDGASQGMTFKVVDGLSKVLNVGSYTLKIKSEDSISAGDSDNGTCTGVLSSNSANIKQDITSQVSVSYKYTPPSVSQSCKIDSSKVVQQVDWGRSTLVNKFDITASLYGSSERKIVLNGQLSMKNAFLQNFWGNFSMHSSFTGNRGLFTGELWGNQFTLSGFIDNVMPLTVGDDPLILMTVNGVQCK